MYLYKFNKKSIILRETRNLEHDTIFNKKNVSDAYELRLWILVGYKNTVWDIKELHLRFSK